MICVKGAVHIVRDLVARPSTQIKGESTEGDVVSR